MNTTTEKVEGEWTPLLGITNDESAAYRQPRASFRRRFSRKSGRFVGNDRSSVRGPFAALQSGDHVDPLNALAPLVAGGVIVSTTCYMTDARAPSVVKSLPAFAPFRRMERHRSFTLWWINEFRHWWKSRLVPAYEYDALRGQIRKTTEPHHIILFTAVFWCVWQDCSPWPLQRSSSRRC